MQRIGILSGSFDPVHKGHVALAQAAIEAAKLDVVYFAPEVKPRRRVSVSHIAHRITMLKLALRPYAKLKVLELPEKNFSAKQTLPKLQALYPGADIVLILGFDLFEHMPHWPQVDLLLQKVELVVGVRGRASTEQARQLATLLPIQPQRLHIVTTSQLDARAGDVRALLANGQTTRKIVPSVESYAKEHWLYAKIPPHTPHTSQPAL